MRRSTGLKDGGGTAGHIGTAWAWYTLSPNWSSLWPSAASPSPTARRTCDKIAILMTDGEYNTEYDKNGVKPAHQNAGRGGQRPRGDAGARPCARR